VEKVYHLRSGKAIEELNRSLIKKNEEVINHELNRSLIKKMKRSLIMIVV
jgi:hypothetical protein